MCSVIDVVRGGRIGVVNMCCILQVAIALEAECRRLPGAGRDSKNGVRDRASTLKMVLVLLEYQEVVEHTWMVMVEQALERGYGYSVARMLEVTETSHPTTRAVQGVLRRYMVLHVTASELEMVHKGSREELARSRGS